jgi:hypothetical protein
MALSDDRQYAPATLRNRDFILNVLADKEITSICADFLVELRGFEPLTSAMRSRRRPGVAAPGRCSRQPRARSAFRDPFRHLGLRRIAGRSWKFFVLRAIDRLDDRTAHSADPVADDPDPADFRIGRRASGSRRRGAAGQLDRPAWYLPSPYWAFRQQRNVVLVGGATDAAQPSERMISR